MKTLEELIKQLPRELQEEVKDFTEFLLEKKKRKKWENTSSGLGWRLREIS